MSSVVVPFSPETQQFIAQSRDMEQAILLHGPDGVHLEDIVTQIAGNFAQRSNIAPDTSKVTPMISISTIRELYDVTRSKQNGRHIVVISDADTMSEQAQNALLKLLEEPPKGVVFALLSYRPDTLLPTILSRVRRHSVVPLSSAQSKDYIKQLGIQDSRKGAQLLYIAEGRVTELRRLAADEAYFDKQAGYLQDAMTLIKKDSRASFSLIQRYQSDRTGALGVIHFMMSIIRKAMTQSPKSQYIDQLNACQLTLGLLERNANIRLALTQLVL